MKNKLTVTIGIPAYNEEANISRLLESLVFQKLTNKFIIKKILVLSDGSTDNTVSISKAVWDKRIEVKSFEKRLGKNSRLNNLFENLTEDVLVLFDADTLVANDKVILNLVKPFFSKNNLGLIAGNAQPLSAQTIIEEAINNFIYALNFMKAKINNEQNIYSVRGPVIALSKEFVKNLVLPLNVPDDKFLYLKCIQNNFEVSYSKKALVYFRSPQTIKDQINQGLRFLKDKEHLYKHFESNFINKEYLIPLDLRIQMFLYQILKNPLAYLILKYLHLQIIRGKDKKVSATWEQIITSKRLIES